MAANSTPVGLRAAASAAHGHHNGRSSRLGSATYSVGDLERGGYSPGFQAGQVPESLHNFPEWLLFTASSAPHIPVSAAGMNLSLPGASIAQSQTRCSARLLACPYQITDEGIPIETVEEQESCRGVGSPKGQVYELRVVVMPLDGVDAHLPIGFWSRGCLLGSGEPSLTGSPDPEAHCSLGR